MFVESPLRVCVVLKVRWAEHSRKDDLQQERLTCRMQNTQTDRQTRAASGKEVGQVHTSMRGGVEEGTTSRLKVARRTAGPSYMYITGECNVWRPMYRPIPSIHPSISHWPGSSPVTRVPSGAPSESSPLDSTAANLGHGRSQSSEGGREESRLGLNRGQTRTLPIHFAQGWAALIGGGMQRGP